MKTGHQIKSKGDEYFQYMNIGFDVDKAETLVEGEPIKTETPTREWILPMVRIDDATVAKANLDDPVLFASIVLDGRVYKILIDGNHRVARALKEGKQVKYRTLPIEKSIKLVDGFGAAKMRREYNKMNKAVKGTLLAVRAGRKSIIFDFDGTISEELEFPEIGSPRWDVVERMQFAMDAGLEVVIQSCRWSEHELNSTEEAAYNLVIAKEWLDAYEIPYDRLVGGKPLGELYVDDKACHVNDLQRLDDMIMSMASEHQDYGSLKVKAEDNKLFWVTPDKEVIRFDEGEHWENLPDDIEVDGDPMGRTFAAQQEGWVRGWFIDNTLGLESYSLNSVEPALQNLPSDLLLATHLVVDAAVPKTNVNIPVDEGEDALKAWRMRNSIRKRVKGRQVVKGFLSEKFWITDKNKYISINDDQHGPYLERNPSVFKKDRSNPKTIEDQAIESGWVRGGLNSAELYMEAELGESIAKALPVIQGSALSKTKMVADVRSPKWITFDVTRSDGETWLDAWARRRVQSSKLIATGEPGAKDTHKKYKAHTETVAASRIQADTSEFGDLQKAALRLVENDPAWKAMIQEPASAQALGNLQRNLRDARSDEELRQAWEQNMDLPWDMVVAEAETSS